MLEMKLYSGLDLLPEEEDFVFSCLLNNSDEGVVNAALALVTEWDEPYLDRLMTTFDEYSFEVRQLAVPCLVCTDYSKCYQFLIERLRRSLSLEEMNLIVLSLAKTDYPVFPLILSYLHDDDVRLIDCLKRVLLFMGFETVAPFLASMPQIPNEALFRHLFGDDRIAKLTQRK